MTNEIIFDNFFKPYGGIYKSDNFLYQRFLKKSNQRLSNLSGFGVYTKPTPMVYFDFINDPTLNAVAAFSDKTGLIGFNGGGLVILYDLFSRILSHSGILREIGDPDSEKYSTPIMGNYCSNITTLKNFGDLGYEKYKQIFPVDNTRKNFSWFLFDIAFDFLFNHELTHILNGHVHYVEKNKNNSDLLIFQTLEMDADCISVCKLLAFHVRVLKKMISPPHGYEQFYKDVKSLVFYIYYAIATTFRIVADNPVYKERELSDFMHDKPRVRQISIAATIREYFNVYFSELKDELPPDLFGNANKEIESHYSLMTGKLSDKSGYHEAASKKGIQQNDRVLSKWKEIKPELNPLSYVTLVT